MTYEEYILNIMPTMGGWCTPAKATRIAEKCFDDSCSLYVEIGVYTGRSFFAASLAMPEYGVAVGIDPWSVKDSIEGFVDENRDWWGKLDHEAIYQECLAMQRRLHLSDKCHLIRANSQNALKLVSRLGPIDVLYVDGNHAEAASMFDAVNYSARVKPGGFIFLDDLDWAVNHDGKKWNTTKRAQEYLGSVCDPVEMIENMGVFRKKS